ncbi:AgmX/PglI C-terminal domain-containing protein [Sorangium sp. So ce260]|uniref:AgmX/PglI C-terminal domain-containing protein n=1 Tax=Sorangium sp. So ce260 TaxID=3133291 RepID=UPI003F6442D6
MSSRRTGLVLVLALAAGCAPPPAQAPAQPAPPEPAGATATAPAGTTSTGPTGATSPAPAGPTPAAGESPPPASQVPGAAVPVETAPPKPAAPKPAASRGDVYVKPGTATATGTLGGSISEAQVRDVVEKHGELFDECYKIGVKSSPKFVGKVTVKATIGPSGKVNKADVIRSTAKNQQVDGCVADAFEKMQFPPPQGGVTTVITFPIEFSGVELVQ